MNAHLFLRLAAPFDPSEVEWKPQTVRENRALAVAYIDARAVMDRLDEVVGTMGWQDRYKVLPDGGVVCALRIFHEGQWVQKMDVGSPSDQPDSGDRMKAAFSDALKRAAVKFGIGRYLYRLPMQWCDYDPKKRQFVRTPTLPAWAIPRATGAVAQAPPVPATAPEARISEQQTGELVKLLADACLAQEDFCVAYKILSPDELPARHYLGALKRIADYKAKIKAKEAS